MISVAVAVAIQLISRWNYGRVAMMLMVRLIEIDWSAASVTVTIPHVATERHVVRHLDRQCQSGVAQTRTLTHDRSEVAVSGGMPPPPIASTMSFVSPGTRLLIVSAGDKTMGTATCGN